jgi:FixJ family two-component response regulator
MTNRCREASIAIPATASSLATGRSGSLTVTPLPSHNGAGALTALKTTLRASIVHIIESNDAIRASLKSLLEAAGLGVLAFPSPDGFLAAWNVERHGCHGCLLLDIDSPGFDGVGFQANLHAAAVHLPIILMSERAELPRCVRNLKPGTVDLLLIPIKEVDLFARVRVACEKDFARVRSDDNFATLTSRYECLTAREKQVLEFVSEGLMNKQIASILNLSVITVKVHRATMMRKMGWRRLVEAVRGVDALKVRAAPPRSTPPEDLRMLPDRGSIHTRG